MKPIIRSHEQRYLLGTAAGLAEATRLPAFLVRAVFILLALASGVGVGLYLLLSLFCPDARSRGGGWRAIVRENVALAGDELREVARTLARWGRDWRGRRWSDELDVRRAAFWGGALVLAGSLWLLASVGLFWWLTLGRFFALLLLSVGAYLLHLHRSQR